MQHHTRAIVAVCLLAVLLASMMALPTARAASVVWTTTADFDSGNKTSVPDYFIENGIDQPTYGFISTPVSIRVSSGTMDRTYIVWQGTADFLPYITFYDEQTRAWATPVAVADSNPVAGDGHGAPAMWIDSRGYIWVFYGSHNTAGQLRVSSARNAIGSWTVKPATAPFMTYPHVFEYGDNVYLLYRDGSLDWTFRLSSDRGETWTAGNVFLPFIASPGADLGWYVYNIVQNGDRLYYSFVRLNATSSIRYSAYSCYWRLTDNHQIGLNGVDMGLSISPAEAEANCLAHDSGTKRTWANAMALDSAGNPYMIFTENGTGSTDNPWNVSFTRWNGSAWTAAQTITTTDGSSSYPALIARSDTDVEAFIITSGFQQLADDDFAGDLERWTWNGATWTFGDVLYREAKAGYAVNRPVVPLNAGNTVRLIFDTWNPSPALIPAMRLYAWGISGFVRNPALFLRNGVETQSDNANAIGGAIQGARGNGETFFTDAPDANTTKWLIVDTGDGSGTISTSFTSGVFRVSGIAAAGTGRDGTSLRGLFEISGNFDTRMKLDLTNPEDDAGTLSVALCLLSESQNCDSVGGANNVGSSGVFYRFFTSPSDIFRAFRMDSGISSQVGADDSVSCDPCFLRIGRSGTTLTFYRSADGSVWTTDETAVLSSPPTTWYVSIGVFVNGVQSGTWALDIDDYSLTAGIANFIGRNVARWVSPVTPYMNDQIIPNAIGLDFSGVSATAYVDSVAITDEFGTVLYEDGTDRTSGMSATIAIPSTDVLISDLRTDWSVRVVIVSASASTPTVTEISVITGLVLTSVEKGLEFGPWLFGFVVAVTLMMMGAWWIKSKRG